MKKIKLFCLLTLILLAVIIIFNRPAKAATYDLKADSLTMNSVKCEVNQLCFFTARVKNLGDNFTLNFLLKSTASADGFKIDSPISISSAQNTVIKTNDYMTFSIYGLFSKIGSFNLIFSVDSTGYLTESDGANNSIGLTVVVTGYDLAVESITVSPDSPKVNQACHIRVAVKNNSSYNLYAESGLNLTRDFPDFSLSQASSTIPSFANVIHNGEFIYYNYDGKFTASGEKTLNFTVDPDDALKESVLTNNSAVKKITVFNEADTDLAINSVSFSATKIILGTPFDLTIGVKNTGKTFLTNAAGLAKSEVSFNLPNFEYGINDLTIDANPTFGSPFKPADIFHYKFHGAFNQSGNFNLAFAVNKNNQLIESTLNNNSTTTAVTVYKSLAEADSFSIISKSVSLVSSTTAIISWKTDLKTTGVLNYNLAHYNVNDNKIDATDNATDHAVTLNNLKPGENYIYAITAKNATAQKTEIISNFSLPEDDVLKEVSGISLNVSGKNAVFSWTTNLISSGRVYYKKRDAKEVSSAGTETLTAEHRVEIKDLALGAYDYFLSSTSTPKTNFKTAGASFEVKAAPAAPAAPAVAPADKASAPAASLSFTAADNRLYERLKGRIILKVEGKGEAYYVSPKEKKIYYLGRPADAFQVIRSQGVGITNGDLEKISVNLDTLSGLDSDADGLPDAFEEAIGADKTKADTDGDGYKDKAELAGGFSPTVKNKKMSYDQALASRQKGKILLQVESRGQAWYINPADGRRNFLSRPADAFNIMRRLGAGVTNGDYAALGGK